MTTSGYRFTILSNVVGLPLARALEVLLEWVVVVPAALANPLARPYK